MVCVLAGAYLPGRSDGGERERERTGRLRRKVEHPSLCSVDMGRGGENEGGSDPGSTYS